MQNFKKVQSDRGNSRMGYEKRKSSSLGQSRPKGRMGDLKIVLNVEIPNVREGPSCWKTEAYVVVLPSGHQIELKLEVFQLKFFCVLAETLQNGQKVKSQKSQEIWESDKDGKRTIQMDNIDFKRRYRHSSFSVGNIFWK